MVIVDVSIIWIALPSIKSGLDASTAGLQWVVNAYTIALAGCLLAAGRAGDLFGRKRLFMLGLGVFTVASLGCGAAQSLGWLEATRAVQGIGGAILLPATLALLTTFFAAGPARDRAMAVWGAIGGLAGTVGFLFGGLLTQAFGWQAIFFINVPVGIVIALFGARTIPADGPRVSHTARELDLGGALLGTAGLAVLVYGIVETERHGWFGGETLLAFAASGLLLAAFAVVELRHPRPLLPLRLFRSRELVSANVAMLLMGAVRFGMWFLMALYMREVLGFTPIEAGLAFIPMLALMSAGSMRAPAVVRRFGFRATVIASFVVIGGGLWLMTSLGVDGSFRADLLLPSLILGLGLGISVVPLTLASVTAADKSDAGLASAIVSVSRQAGGALGVAVLSAVAAAKADSGVVTPQSLTDGFRLAFWVAVGFALVGALIATFLPPSTQRRQRRVLSVDSNSV
jgi:EmrB/QacA subfamily drug resistance transporter